MATQAQSKSRATSMADLMKSVSSTFISPKKGDVLEGTIKKLQSSEILVDIGAKTEAVVLEKDKRLLRNLLSSLKVGDKVNVFVLNPESDMGYTVVSLRRFIDDKLWIRLADIQKNKEKLDVIVNEITKGGFLVSTSDGIAGFLPNSQTVFIENSQNLLGKTLQATVIEINRPQRKIIFSQKIIMGSENFDNAVKALKVGDKVEATISNIAPFGIFTSVEFSKGNFVEGFIHISEISWEQLPTIPDTFKVGDKVEAVVKDFDKEAKRLNFSIKALTKDPFEEKVKNFAVDQKLKATVSRVTDQGLIFDFEGVEGILKKEKIPPTVNYAEGDSLNLMVSEIDKRKRRIVLVPVLMEKPIGYR